MRGDRGPLPRPTDDTPPGSRGSGWSGWATNLLYVSVIAFTGLGKFVDGNVPISASDGRTYIYQGGSVGRSVSVVLVLLVALCSVMAIVRGRPSRIFASVVPPFVLMALGWWVLAVLLWRRDEVGPTDLFVMVVGLLLAVGLISDPPRTRELLWLNRLRDTLALLAIVVSVAFPAIAQRPCREDKCGLFGGMWTGFAYHENTAATAFVVMLPLALLYRRRWQRATATLVVTVLALGTGSRTIFLALAAAIGVLVLGDRWTRRGVPRWVLLAPLATFVASTLIYLGIVPVQLTGRDWIYGAIRDATHGYDGVFGAGSGALKQRTGGWIVGEHGEASHVLLQTGWVGYGLMVVLFCAVAAVRAWGGWRRTFAAGLLLVASMRALTEPSLMFEVRTVEFVSLVLAAGLFAAPPDPGEATVVTARTKGRPAGRGRLRGW